MKNELLFYDIMFLSKKIRNNKNYFVISLCDNSSVIKKKE